jgi:predicted DNA-binding transcriptional regulator YafY
MVGSVGQSDRHSMSRSSRLLDLVQALRRHRRPVTAAVLADELGVSIRTIYRDIVTLTAQGAPVEGEAGIGYVLKPGFVLPPLMLSEEEIEAVVLGLRFVAQRGDPGLKRAAIDAAAKIAEVLPEDLRNAAVAIGLLAGPTVAPPEAPVDIALLRQAIRSERKLRLSYMDKHGQPSERVVWPIALGFFEQARVLAAWCETRAGFRHFRADRIGASTLLPERYPRRRAALLKDWREAEGIDEQF